MGTHTTHRRARTGLIAAALLLGAAVTACSDDSSDGAKDTTTTSTTVAGSSTTVAADQGQPIEGFGDYTSQNYDGAAHWLCRPDKAADVCGQDLDATQVDADGTLTPQPFEAAVDPPIDCFYVYPTISQDQSPTSDWTPSPDEEEYVTLNQPPGSAASAGSSPRCTASSRWPRWWAGPRAREARRVKRPIPTPTCSTPSRPTWPRTTTVGGSC